MRMLVYTVVAAALLSAGLTASVRAEDATALSLIKKGNHYVSDEAKDKVVEIRSEKSVGSLTPNVWYVVYYDADATFKATEVKFGAGEKMDVKRPARILEFASDASKRLDPKELKIDSDQAIAIAKKDALLENLKLTSAQLWLQHSDDGAMWKVKFWAQKLRRPEDEADIGEIHILAADGKVLKRDWHVEHVN